MAHICFDCIGCADYVEGQAFQECFAGFLEDLADAGVDACVGDAGVDWAGDVACEGVKGSADGAFVCDVGCVEMDLCARA